MVFRSPDQAEAHQGNIVRGLDGLRESVSPRPEIVRGVLGLGPHSYQRTVNADGVGGLIGFLLSPYVVQLHTTLPEGGGPLVTPEQLRSLSESVRATLGTPR